MKAASRRFFWTASGCACTNTELAQNPPNRHNARAMPHEDFDIESLAQYLHLAAGQVLRMAERGKLPGRRIGEQWRFSQAEIHHWLEDRIGVSDAEELSHVTGALDRAGPDDEAAISLAGLLNVSAIAVPLDARTRGSVVSAMTELAANAGLLWDPEKMAEAVRARENLHPTALENGVALLHPRRPLPGIIAEPFLALGITSQGIPFGGGRGNLTDVFFLIASADDRGHLRTLARLSRLISDAELLSGMRHATSASEVGELISSAEAKLLS
jgi:PTS system nitrogen regulatory IIA component